MKYTDEEILAHARAHTSHMDQQKGMPLVLGFMGMCGIAAVILFVTMLVDKSEKVDGLFRGASFVSGVALGILATITVGISVLGFLRMFNMFYGKDIEVYRLLVRLDDKNNG